MPRRNRHTNADPATPHLATGKYFDRIFECDAIKVLPGEFFVTTRNMALVTVLGSCVSACLRDRSLNIGGMNHFMLPEEGGNGPVSSSARYGAFAMELLLNHLFKLGARREGIEAKVFGGGRVMPSLANTQVGDRNAEFVLDYLKTEGIPVVASDLLDVYPRKVYYFPASGRVMVKRLVHMGNDTVMRRERDYAREIRSRHLDGDVELFGV